MNKLRNILLLIALSFAVAASAQSERPEVRASLTPDSVLLGDEVLLTIDVRKDQVQVVGFPSFDTGENGELELIEELPLDTVERDGRRQHLRKRYTFRGIVMLNHGLHPDLRELHFCFLRNHLQVVGASSGFAGKKPF